MATIDQLASADALASNDLIPIHQTANDDTRKVTVGVLAARVHELSMGEPDHAVYGVAMTGNTFTVTALPTIAGGSVWVHLSLPQTADSGTIILPDAANRANGQEVLVTCTRAVTSLIYNGMGASIAGAPSAIGMNGFFRLRFDSVTNIWFRIG